MDNKKLFRSNARKVEGSILLSALLLSVPNAVGASNAHASAGSLSSGPYATPTVVKNASSQADNSQKIDVKGTVVDVHGEPLTGVTIKVKGATLGAVTDIDGNFTLKAAKGAVLECSYVGYTTQTVAVTGASLHIVMNEDSKELTEVVVTALGIKRQEKALSYNVQQVKADAITDVKDANFMNSLAGKVAGLTINTSSSGVGGASKVVMRGNKSILQSSNALYVIDGIPMYNTGGGGGTEFDSRGATEAIADLNPEDIESMSVLTGASAAALYGSEAANGAIMITTK